MYKHAALALVLAACQSPNTPLLYVSAVDPALAADFQGLEADLAAIYDRPVIATVAAASDRPGAWRVLVDTAEVDAARLRMGRPRLLAFTDYASRRIVLPARGAVLQSGMRVPEYLAGVLAHELGHAMGLSHSEGAGSVMFGTLSSQCDGEEAKCLAADLCAQLRVCAETVNSNPQL